MMNKTMALIAGAILILGGIFYFTNNNEKENKVFQKEKQKTSTQKEVKNIKQKEQEKTEKLVQKKKEETNPRGPVIYKNDETNKGYNMELKVPAKWAHLDYSRLGNPPEVELPKEEWAAGDQLYSKDDPRYYQDGKKYFSKEAEKLVLDLFQNKRKQIRMIFDDPADADEFFEKYFNDINNLIYIDEKTGRKMLKESTNKTKHYASYSNAIYVLDKAMEYLFKEKVVDYDFLPGGNWEDAALIEINKKEIQDENEKFKIYQKWALRAWLFGFLNLPEKFNYAYYHKNKSADEKWEKENEDEFCKPDKELDEEKCWYIIYKQKMHKYLKGVIYE